MKYEMYRRHMQIQLLRRGAKKFTIALLLLTAITATAADKKTSAAETPNVAVGPEYGTTHVYIAPANFDAFVNSFVATFGGKPFKRITGNVLPSPANAQLQYVLSPVGALSIFAFETPIPYPFGQERTGWLVTDMDQAVKAARAAGAEVLVEPFKDPIGRDAVIQWPGGVKMQLYWHFTPPKNPPLDTLPENRVYVSRDEADHFVRCFLRFSHGNVTADDRKADAGEIGRPGETYRRIRITSLFGNVLVLVTDGHSPYPFGSEITGYLVRNFYATLEEAKAAGVKILFGPYTTMYGHTAIVQFPGGYIAEIHGPIHR